MLKRLELFYWRITKKKIMAECGHETLMVGKIVIQDKPYSFSLENTGEKPECCLDCLQKAIINCAWCGSPILPGDPITLYKPNSPEFVPKEGSRQYIEDPEHYIGCLRTNCCDCGIDRAGFWEYPGEVRRVPSILQTLIGNPDIKMAICSDTSKDEVTFIE